MRIWDWYNEHENQILEDPHCSPAQVEMIQQFNSGSASRDPSFSLKKFARSRELAESVGDEAFQLWCDVWIGREFTQMHNLRESREVLARAAMRARHKKFAGLPQQIMASVLLVDRMAEMDPIGYLGAIEDTTDYLMTICHDEHEHLCVLSQTLVNTYIEVDQLDKARAHHSRLQQEASLLGDTQSADSNYHMAVYALLGARLSHLERSWDNMLRFADSGAKHNSQDPETRGTLAMARANALAHLGDQDAAGRSFRTACRQCAKHMGYDFYELATDYWLALGRQDKAIDLRLQQQKQAEGKERFWEQTKSAVHLVRMYRANGDHEQAQEWTQRAMRFGQMLRKPESVETLLSDCSA